jgi:hypothetical protein
MKTYCISCQVIIAKELGLFCPPCKADYDERHKRARADLLAGRGECAHGIPIGAIPCHACLEAALEQGGEEYSCDTTREEAVMRASATFTQERLRLAYMEGWDEASVEEYEDYRRDFEREGECDGSRALPSEGYYPSELARESS